MDSVQTPYVDHSSVTTGFAQAEFADNPEPRCPCILLLDTSGSMAGHAIAQLNAGLQTFKDELASDTLAAKRVEVAVITFGGNSPQLLTDFTEASLFQPPVLSANGTTPMGAAIKDAIQRVNARKETYRANGISYYRPWIFLITDGAPTDEYQSAAQLVRDGEAQGRFSFYAVGIAEADFATLTLIAPSTRPPLKLDGLRFRDLFQWLSKSMRTVSTSTPGNAVSLDTPGWVTAQT
jgi:uncharacterized protein YegL